MDNADFQLTIIIFYDNSDISKHHYITSLRDFWEYYKKTFIILKHVIISDLNANRSFSLIHWKY